MTSRIAGWSGWIVAMCILCIGANRPTEPIGTRRPLIDVESILAGIESPVDVRRGRTYEQLRGEYGRLWWRLLRIADTPKNKYETVDDSRELAVRLLGELERPEAVPVLMKHIDWRVNRPVMKDIGGEIDSYPCAVVLFKHYRPEFNERLLRHLTTSDPEDVSHDAIVLYASVLGADRAEWITKLKDYANKRPHKKTDNVNRLLMELRRREAGPPE